MTYDVIVVGAGPAGSSAATFLAARGLSTLVLDRATFPRDKVCGDGLTPQALYWIDRLGCIDDVLEQTRGCLKHCDLFVNGRHLLTSGFPDDTPFPDFAVLLERRRLDHILLQNARRHGARVEEGQTVRAIACDAEGVTVTASARNAAVAHRGRIVIGADGVSSMVSRAIGNRLNHGATAVSLRTYYRGVRRGGSQIKVFFGRDYFPGYGWMFVDDDGLANVGLGYAFDLRFPMRLNLRTAFDTFVERELGPLLDGATRCSAVSGGAASFYRPERIVADRAMLIGDAANHADPLNGGGIHKAMESAWIASHVASEAIGRDRCTRDVLQAYEDRWLAQFDVDWRVAELALAVAANPAMKDVCLSLLTRIGRLTSESRQFRDFCSGVFSGVIARDACLSPRALYRALPHDPAAWLALLQGGSDPDAGPVDVACQAFDGMAGAARAVASDPLTTADWGLDLLARAVRLLDRQVSSVFPVAAAI